MGPFFGETVGLGQCRSSPSQYVIFHRTSTNGCLSRSHILNTKHTFKTFQTSILHFSVDIVQGSVKVVVTIAIR